MKITKSISISLANLVFCVLLDLLSPILVYANSNSFTETTTLCGVDILVQTNFNAIAHKKIALLTNQTGRNSKGLSTLEILKNANNLSLKYVFSPEHGYFTSIPAGKKVEDEIVDGVKIHSLYGFSKSPQKKYLDSIDVFLIDIQDIGVRSYTYISSIFLAIQSCAKFGIPVLVLDRPNPLGGTLVDGNIVEKDFVSYVSKIPVSYIHGCTIGELSAMMVGEKWLDVEIASGFKLDILKMENWKRTTIWENTGLLWIPSSPHVPNINSIRGLAITGMLGELGVLSIGIGTTSPFSYLGDINKTIDINELSAFLSKYNLLNGVHLTKTKYQPNYGLYNGKSVDGIYLTFAKDKKLSTYSAGIMLISFLIEQRHIDKSQIKPESINMFNKVCGTNKIWNELSSTNNPDTLMKLLKVGFDDFVKLRQKYLIYQ